MAKRPLILITNDDGIQSPGLRAAAEAVADLGELVIMAPSHQQTGAGRSYRLDVDKTISKTQLPLLDKYHPAHHAPVSPAQAVLLGVTELAERPIDLCLSGINHGENIGSGVTISGTVGAALEAACFGIPAMAVSFETPQAYHVTHSSAVDFKVAGHFTRQFAQKILTEGLPPQVYLLKIDIPASATPETGWRVGKMSRQRYYQSIKRPKAATQSETDFQYRVHIDHDQLDPNSDVQIFAIERRVAVVPMTIDLTAPVSLETVTQFYKGST